MRQLKAFMRNRKKEMLACGPCECRTLQCWRYANENCGCGEGGSPLPPLHNMIEVTSENSAAIFGENETTNFIEINIETDPETGDSRVFVYPHGIFADERYVRDGVNVWEDVLVMMDIETARNIMEYGFTKFPSKIFNSLDAVYKDPSAENIEAAQNVMGERIPLYGLQNIIDATSENSAQLFYDGDNRIDISKETDAETGLPRVVVYPQGAFDSEWFEIDGENIWSSIFSDETWTNMKYWLDWATEFPSDVFSALNTVYQDPTIENAQAANNAIIGWKPTITNKAYGTPDGETYMFVGPDLYADGDYIDIYLETDPETGDNHLIVYGSGIFDTGGAYGESASLIVGAFEMMDMEWIHQWILGDHWLTGYNSDLGTINSDCMRLVQAIFDNPTEANQQALITFFEELDAREAEQPTGAQLIIDDAQSDRIREGLESIASEDIQEVITRSDEGEQSWEPLVIEDYYTYYLQATAENSADVRVYVGDYMYGTTVGIETDQETEESRTVVGESYPAPYAGLDE